MAFFFFFALPSCSLSTNYTGFLLFGQATVSPTSGPLHFLFHLPEALLTDLHGTPPSHSGLSLNVTSRSTFSPSSPTPSIT